MRNRKIQEKITQWYKGTRNLLGVCITSILTPIQSNIVDSDPLLSIYYCHSTTGLQMQVDRKPRNFLVQNWTAIFFLSFHFDFRYSETRGNKNMQLVCNIAAKRVEEQCSVFAPTFKPIVQQIKLLQKEERSSTICNKICTFSVFYRTKANLLNSKWRNSTYTVYGVDST